MSPLREKEVNRLRLLDGPEPIVLKGSQFDMAGAKKGDPCECVFANTCHRADLEAVVLRTVTWVVTEATKPLLAFNRAQRGADFVRGIRVGEKVRVRYRNDSRLREQIRLWDDEGREFVPGEFALLPFYEPEERETSVDRTGVEYRPGRAVSGGGVGQRPLPRSGLERRPPATVRVSAARALA